MLDNILKSRNSFLGASSIDEKADADRQISKALKSVFALSEAYPELSSNENFLKLQGRISGLENQISDRRELYNDSVNNYNIRIQSIPDTFVAKALTSSIIISCVVRLNFPSVVGFLLCVPCWFLIFAVPFSFLLSYRFCPFL